MPHSTSSSSSSRSTSSSSSSSSKGSTSGEDVDDVFDCVVENNQPVSLVELDLMSTVANTILMQEYENTNIDVQAIKSEYFCRTNLEAAAAVKLPIRDHRKAIITAINSYDTVIIEGNTGCGKSTQVPLYILENAILEKHKAVNIYVTQPRKIAARNLALRVANEHGWALPSIIGYQVGLDKKLHDHTMITYCTTGVLLQRLINEKSLQRISHIVVDEVHERDADTDLLLMIIRKFMKEQSTRCSLIIMSATMEAEKLREYFNMPQSGHLTPSVIKIRHTENLSPITYLESLSKYAIDLNNTRERMPSFIMEEPEFFTYCVNITVNLIVDTTSNSRDGSVLVFLPGIHEISHVKQQLMKRSSDFQILALHSSLSHDHQQKVFDPALPGKRKVILATNIAESSITVPDIETVIDFCLTKSLVLDAQHRFPSLKLLWASKDRCIQRAGRAGRVRKGQVFRLVPRSFFIKLHEFADPELLTAPLELSVLRVKQLEMGSPRALLALVMDPPEDKEVTKAVLELKQIGALSLEHGGRFSEDDGHITELGAIIVALPLDVHLSKLIVMGYIYGCLEDAVIIAACLTGKALIRNPFNEELENYKKRLYWSRQSLSDCIVYAQVYKEYRRLSSRTFKNLEFWCKNNHVDMKKIKEVEVLETEIYDRLLQVNLVEEQQPNRKEPNYDMDEIMLKLCLCAAFYPNYYTSREIEPRAVSEKLYEFDPCSSVYIEGLPKDQGPIYLSQIRNIFEEVCNDIDVTFEASRAVIRFRDQPGKVIGHQENEQVVPPGSVIMPVYLALKMGQYGNLSIREYKKAEALKRLEYYNKKRAEHVAGTRILPPTRVKVVTGNCRRPKFHQWIKFDSITYPIKPTHVLSCGRFYARLICNNDVNQYYADLDDLIDPQLLYEPQSIEELIGSMAFAQLPSGEDTAYHRIEIRSAPDAKQKVQVFFYDIGLTTLADRSNIRSISDESYHSSSIDKIPILAFECRLYGIKPAPWASRSGGWSGKATTFFHDTLTSAYDGAFEAKVFSVIDNVVNLDLTGESIRTGMDTSGSMRTRLVEMGEAIECDESDISIRDNQLRERYIYSKLDSSSSVDQPTPDDVEATRSCAIQNDEEQQAKDDEVLREESLQVESENFVVFCPERTRIKGPYSPIELKFGGLTSRASERDARVERQSINSVALDGNYLERRIRFMVAASVTQNQNKGIVLRDTTIMPDIPGLHILAPLLFAPNYEYRVSPSLGCLSGALFGLGWDDYTNESINEENDFELQFEYMITEKDIQKINTCRLLATEIIKLLSVEDPGHTLGEKRDQLRDTANSLIRQRRFPLPKCGNSSHLMKWNIAGRKDLDGKSYWTNLDKYKAMQKIEENAQVARTVMDTISDHLFNPIVKSPKLDEKETFRLLVENLKYLENIVNRTPGTQQVVNKEMASKFNRCCLLCDGGYKKFVTASRVSEHMYSDHHRRRVQELKLYSKQFELDFATV